MTDIIKLLKKNRYPFGMWPGPECYGKELGKEMQDEAARIGFAEFWVYTEFGQTAMEQLPVWGKHPKRFEWDHAFRLRPDYEDEPEIEEYAIEFNRNSNYQYYIRENERCISDACDDPDFIGFKFEDDPVIYDSPIIYSFKDDTFRDAHLEHLCSGEAKVLHASHVLFRRPK